MISPPSAKAANWWKAKKAHRGNGPPTFLMTPVKFVLTDPTGTLLNLNDE
jgi:hypothetical protein